ncbi:MAG TPA: hypothetical protein DCF84_05845 [Bacteroidetes bacterium]|nr:hypothetical protein [Bacteroidota bacterium]|tara:strand:+ start:790 stop:1221 length:432 start_codon:yes stop_codon:yes gene_type:complete
MDILRTVLIFLAVSITTLLHAQVDNKEIKSCLVLSFNEISLLGSDQEAVYQDIASLCGTGDCSIEEIATFLPNLPSSNRNLSTFLKRKHYSFETDLPSDSLASIILLSIEDNLLVKSFMERSEDRPTRVHTALVKWINLFKES